MSAGDHRLPLLLRLTTARNYLKSVLLALAATPIVFAQILLRMESPSTRLIYPFAAAVGPLLALALLGTDYVVRGCLKSVAARLPCPRCGGTLGLPRANTLTGSWIVRAPCPACRKERTWRVERGTLVHHPDGL